MRAARAAGAAALLGCARGAPAADGPRPRPCLGPRRRPRLCRYRRGLRRQRPVLDACTTDVSGAAFGSGARSGAGPRRTAGRGRSGFGGCRRRRAAQRRGRRAERASYFWLAAPCLSGARAASAASCAARPRGEQRREVGAKHRPPSSSPEARAPPPRRAPRPGPRARPAAECRDALRQRIERTSGRARVSPDRRLSNAACEAATARDPALR
jgi:hypothetical protein